MSLMSDRQHKSDDHDTWLPRCAGCLPEDVRPHRCVARIQSFGFVGGRCYCDEPDCVERSRVQREAWKAEQDARVVALRARLREMGYPPLDVINYTRAAEVEGQFSLFD